MRLRCQTAALATAVLAMGCGERSQAAAAEAEPAPAAEAPPGATGLDAEAAAEAERRQKLDAEFPLHGLVTGVQLKVRDRPDPEASVIGWLRVGSRVRLAEDPTKTPTCATGWYPIHPRGYACAGEGIDVAPEPPESVLAQNPPAKDAALPYRYYFVKEPKVPEYHRLPSRGEQRDASAFVARYLQLLEKGESRAAKLLAGELPNEPKSPLVVRRYLDRTFFVAGAGIEERNARKFVRTVRGSYVKLSQLVERTGSSFHGVELDEEHTLPLAWAVRDAQPFNLRPRDDGSNAMIADEAVEPFARQALLPWDGYERVGTQVFHRLKDGHYLKHWFAAVAQRIDRPSGIGADEPWVHINLDQQTLVLYTGDTPVYATLVSSGLEGHDTPTGLFEVRQKYVANTMSDLGPEAGDDRYMIDDVPWTQYFDGSIALHGAFWHERFGLRRSHGCVNLAPLDAHRVFNHTWPELADGWHGVSTDHTGFAASKIYITAE